MKNQVGFAVLLMAAFAASAAGQSQTDAQAGAQASGQTSAQVGKQGAQAGASESAAASSAAQAGQSSVALASGSTFNAALSAPVDSKKAKPGDPVNAKTTEAVKSEGKTVLPKGTKLEGGCKRALERGMQRLGDVVQQTGEGRVHRESARKGSDLRLRMFRFEERTNDLSSESCKSVALILR